MRWKHLSALTDQEQSDLLTFSVVNRARVQLGIFTAVLLFVSAVIIALIIYTHDHGQAARDRHAQTDRGHRPHHHWPRAATGADSRRNRLRLRGHPGLPGAGRLPARRRSRAGRTAVHGRRHLRDLRARQRAVHPRRAAYRSATGNWEAEHDASAHQPQRHPQDLRRRRRRGARARRRVARCGARRGRRPARARRARASRPYSM